MILALDPGGITGYAVFWRENENKVKLIESGEFPRYNGLPSLLNKYQIKVIVCERFVVTRNFTRGGKIQTTKGDRDVTSMETNVTDPIEVIGALKFYLDLRVLMHLPETLLVFQQPGDRLMAEKWHSQSFPYPKIKSHAKSALLHGMYYIGKSVIPKTYE